jgi:hypothetical protein
MPAIFLAPRGIAFCADHGKDTGKVEGRDNSHVEQLSAAAHPPAAKASVNHIEH